MLKKILFCCLYLLFQSAFSQNENFKIREAYRSAYYTVKKHILNKDHMNCMVFIRSFGKSIDRNSTYTPILDAFYSDFYLSNNQYSEAIENVTKALKKITSETPDEVKAIIYNCFANYYLKTESVKLSEEYANKALAHAIKTNNFKLLGDIYYNLYWVFSFQQDIQEDEFAQKSLDMYKKAEDYNGVALAYSAKYWGVKNQYIETGLSIYKDSIKYYLYQGILANQRYPNKVSYITNSINYPNLAKYYLNQNNEKKLDKSSCLDSINKYLSVIEAIDPNKDLNYAIRSNCSNIRGSFCFQNNDLENAEKIFVDSYTKLKKANIFPSTKSLKLSTQLLIDLYKRKGDRTKYLEYFDERFLYTRLIVEENRFKKAKSLEAKIQNSKIKQELVFEQKENIFKKKQLLFAIVLIILSIISILSMIYSFKNKTLAKKRKLELITKEKQEALSKIELQKEQYSRLLAEQKILKIDRDKIRNKVIENAIQIERKNELLDNIRTKLEKNDLRMNEIKNSLRIEKYNEQELSKEIDEFKNIHPDFFNKLNEVSNNKLTKLDLRYCVYINIGLSNISIAKNLNIEPRSVRTSKYRIKKKLKLGTEETIEGFLKKIMDSI